MHEFYKGCGFPTLTDDAGKEKIEEQLGKATKTKIDRINRLTHKIQKKLCKLIKEKKITNKTYFELYPSGPIHHVCTAQSKSINQKKTFPCDSLFLQ